MEQEQHEFEFQCLICNQLILKPAMLPCKHQFCCYCIRSIKRKHQENQIVCPLCRRVSEWAPLNKKREIEVVKTILGRPNIRVFWAQGATVNDYDGNKTVSRGFFYIMIGNKFIGDIIWGGGSQHDSYIEEVGRCSGTVTAMEGKDFAYVHGYECKYSNGPHEDWSGTFTSTGDRTFALQHGRYMWHWQERQSSGTLLMKLRQIKEGEDPNMYNQNALKAKANNKEVRDSQCQNCKQTMFNPVVLPCYHQYCAFCLRSKFGKGIVTCPLCGVRSGQLAIDHAREREIMRELIKRPNVRVFEGTASTTNDYDKNLTKSQLFFFILKNDYLMGDMIWGGGTQHNTYVGAVGRVTGKVTLLEEGQFSLGPGYGAVYSNTPTEDWSGSFKRKGQGKLVLQKGRYNWHGWGRNSSGTLEIQLQEMIIETI